MDSEIELQHFSKLVEKWQLRLLPIYDHRESLTMLRFACEDVLSISSSTMFLKNYLFSENEMHLLDNLLDNLILGKPYQYTVGFVFFCDLKFISDQRALIPRPETEELVFLIHEKVSSEFSGKILDLCSGSGCISLALKSLIKNASIVGYEISKEALALAKENATYLNLDVKFQKENVLHLEINEMWDVIVSNPPYIPQSECKDMRQNVLRFEPELALFVPDHDALMFYNAISKFAKKALNPKGMLFFEIHENRGDEVIQILKNNGFLEIKLHLDLSGKSRMVSAQVQ